MKRPICLALAVYLMTGSTFAQQPLPISRILLYKNGMAYIVRTGEIRTPLNLTFRPDEMNDVLKTFSAWNPTTSALYQVGYTTGVGADHLLSRFPFDLRSSGNGLAAFLTQIKGAPLKLDAGGRAVSGQLVAIVQEGRAVQSQTIVQDHRLTLLSGGSVQSVWLSDVRSLEIEDPDLANQLRTYLEILAEGRQDVTREVTIYPAAAAGPVNVAYVQQFPLWKTSYRLDLSKAESRIQGWSQIDNPTGETWDNVDVTLVSGMPTSFVMELYEPLYTRRETVRVPTSVAAGPRQYDAALNTTEQPATANTIYGVVREQTGAVIPGASVTARDLRSGAVYSARTDDRGSFAIPNLAPGMFQVTVQLPGFITFTQNVQLAPNGQSSVNAVLGVGSSSETVGIDAAATGRIGPAGFGRSVVAGGVGPGPGQGVGVLGGVLRAQEAAAAPPPASAQGADIARVQDYFEYRFPFPIRLGARQSALLPFLNKPIKAEKVSIFKSGVDRDHPLNGASIENSADVPLEPGPITFFLEGRYAGETVVEYLSRGERRLVSYGVDYDIQADTQRSARPEQTTRVTAARGVVSLFRESVQTTQYKFRNKGQEAKIIVLEHPREQAKALRDLKAEETTASAYRFRITAQPGQEIEFPVAETVSRQNTVAIRTLDRPTFELMFSGSEIPAELRSRLGTIIAARERLAELQNQKGPLQENTKKLFEDQERLRENLKALSDSREERDLRQRYLAELQSQEDGIKNLRNRLEDLTRQIADQEALVSRLISDLSWS